MSKIGTAVCRNLGNHDVAALRLRRFLKSQGGEVVMRDALHCLRPMETGDAIEAIMVAERAGIVALLYQGSQPGIESPVVLLDGAASATAAGPA